MSKNKEIKSIISVIVPVYNVEQFLPQCLESILRQSVYNLQIILIDDGSTDASGNICDEYAAKDTRITVIHQKNKGVSAARNAGLKMATGTYIAFADSDDVLPKSAYKFLLKQIENADMALGQVQLMSEDSKLLSTTGEYHCSLIEDQVFLYDLFGEKRFPYLGYPCDKLYKRKIIEDNGLQFDRKIKLNEDRLFVLQYAINCSIIRCCDEVVYYYRQRSTGVITETRQNVTVTDSELTVIDSFRKMQNICAGVTDDLYFACCRKSFESALDLLNRVSKQDKRKVQVIEDFLKESAQLCLKNPQYSWKEKGKIIGHTILKH